MKSLVVIGSLVLLGAAAGAIADTSSVPRSVVRAAEISLDERFSRIWPDNPSSLIGRTRGVYLDGYGVVFIAEVEPVSAGGTGLMDAPLRPEQKAQIKQNKIARIADLKKVLKQALIDAAASLDPVPPDQEIVIEVTVSRFYWEDGSGYPAELIVQGPKRKLLDVKRAGGAGMDAAIRVTER